MEDSFSVRVDRVFGSLPSSSPSSSSQPLSTSLWCLTDEEIQKRLWNRETASLADAGGTELDDTDDDDDGPFPSSVDRLLSAMKGKLAPDYENPNPNPNPNPNSNPGDFRQELEDDLQDLDDDAGEGTSGGGDERGSSLSTSRAREVADDEEEELDVRNSIGMDCTLELEKEEDEHDKVAVGSEKTGDRVYMSDVTDYMPDYYSHSEVPTTFKEACRDPRANHLAAKLRLKEDAETARSFNSLQVSERTEAVVSDTQNSTSENTNNRKSILKRKDQVESKSEKRVRFEPGCKNSDETEGDKNAISEACNAELTLQEETSSQHQDSSFVPDYIRNPSRYTHYTFDSSSDMNEESNRLAYADFLDMVKKSKQSDLEEVPADLSKPVIFNPKKKTGQDLMPVTSNETGLIKEITMEEPMHRKSLPVSFASGGTQEDETCEMEVDEQVIGATKVGGGKRRTTRKYRSKPGSESNEYDC